jgi:hypothetical protein
MTSMRLAQDMGGRKGPPLRVRVGLVQDMGGP